MCLQRRAIHRATAHFAMGVLLVACTSAPTPTALPTPTAQPTPTPGSLTSEPTPTPTPRDSANPVACSEPDLVWHATLRELVLVNCLTGDISLPINLWAWNGDSWRKIAAEGGPVGRVLGGAAYDASRDVIVAYGGFPADSFECAPETWQWDGSTWTEIDADPPPSCHHFRMTYDATSERVLIFGGQGADDAPVSETWAWDGAAWSLVTAEGPPSRAHFGFVNDPNHGQTLLYGGYDGSMYEDFWSLRDGTWEEIDFEGPDTRSHFGMAYDTDANALYLYGGATTSSSFSSLTDETWVLTNGAWQQLETPTNPGVRGSAALGYDPDSQRLVLYGGFTPDGQELADTWEFDGTDWTCLRTCVRRNV